MARGQKKQDPKLQEIPDLSTFIPRMMEYVLGERDRLSDEGKEEISIPQLCTFMEGLLTQIPEKQSKGRVEVLRSRVKDVTEICFASHFANDQKSRMLQGMLTFGDIGPSAFEMWNKQLSTEYKSHHRDTVMLAVEVYRTIHGFDQVKKPKNRPKGSFSKITKDFDEEVIRRVLEAENAPQQQAERDMNWSDPDRKSLSNLREQIKIALDAFPGLRRGSGDPKSEIDTHAKRIKRKIPTLTKTPDKK